MNILLVDLMTLKEEKMPTSMCVNDKHSRNHVAMTQLRKYSTKEQEDIVSRQKRFLITLEMKKHIQDQSPWMSQGDYDFSCFMNLE